MKKYIISYNVIFGMGTGKPWVVNIDGSKDTYTFKTEEEARAWVAARDDGELVKVSKWQQKFSYLTKR